MEQAAGVTIWTYFCWISLSQMSITLKRFLFPAFVGGNGVAHLKPLPALKRLSFHPQTRF